jgi:hypothetical protein
MSMNALELEDARHRARQRVPRSMGWGELHASLLPADRSLLARWTRGVTALYASLALLVAVSLFAFHDRSTGHDAQTAGLQRAQMN